MNTTEQIKSAADVAKAKMPALVEFYNANASKPVKKFADIATARKRCAALFPKEAAPAKAKPAKAAAPKEPKAPADRSAAIAASWLRPDVAAKRIERTSVKVKGETFDSVRKAFLALGLPLSVHIRFRMTLKANGSAVFEHEGKKYQFTVVEATA